MIFYVDLAATKSDDRLALTKTTSLSAAPPQHIGIQSLEITTPKMDSATDLASTSAGRPTDDEINRLFEEALKSMDLQPAKVRELRNCDMEKKLKIALDMRKTTDFKAPAEYLHELAVAIDSKKSTKKKKKVIKEQTSTTILKHIEISLRTNPIQWLIYFLSSPNNGLTVLVDYLLTLQEEQFGSFDASEIDLNGQQLESKPSSEDSATLKPSKSRSKMSVDVSGADDIQVLVLCFRAIMNTSVGFNCFFADDNAIYSLTKCILHPNLRTKSCVFELLSVVCLVGGGHEKIIAAFDKFRVEFKESHRFKTLMWMVSDPVNLNNVDFVTASMQLINVLVHSVEDVNYRCFLQQEFTNLGLEEFLKEHEDEESEQLQTQFIAYLKNRINLDEIMLKAEQLDAVEQKLNSAIQQISDQREKYQHELGAINERNKELAAKLEILFAEREELLRTSEEKEKSLRTLERQQFETEKKLRNVEGQLTAEVQKTKKAIEKELSKPSTPVLDQTLKKSGTLKLSASTTSKVDENCVDSVTRAKSTTTPTQTLNATSEASSPFSLKANKSTSPPLPPAINGIVKGPPAAPPPPPNLRGGPPPPPNLKGGPPPPPFLNPLAKQTEPTVNKKVVKTNVKLPAFNWTTMPTRNVKDTVFHHLDDEKLVDVLNLTFIENMFGESDDSKAASSNGPPSPGSVSTATSSNHSAATILDPKKLQNIAIMRRKLGKSIVDVMSAIHKLNLSQLSSDEVDMLSRMLAQTHDDVKNFEHYVQENGSVEGLSMDEQFVWKLQNIERVEIKLKLMTFMAEFGDMVKKIEPEICKIELASKAVMESKKFQKVLEVLLAIGNAMNAGRNRPLVYGFKLSTLSRLTMQKSPKDPNITILHGLVDVIEHSNVECIDFTKEFNFVDDASTVILSDVDSLYNNLANTFKIASDECERDNLPLVLQNFVDEARPKIERIGEKLTAAKREFAACTQLFGEDSKSQTPKNFFSLIHDFALNFDAAREQLQKRKAEKGPKPLKSLATAYKRAQDTQVMKELNLRFGNGTIERKPTHKTPSNQMADGDLERMMTGLKEAGFVASGKIRKPMRPHVGDLQELSAAGYREVCRERQA